MRQLKDSDLELIKNTLFGEFGIYKIKNGLPETLYISANLPQACGMTREEFLALTEQDATGIVLPSDRPQALKDLQQCITTGTPIDTRYRIHLKNNHSLWIRARGHICGILDETPILCISYTSVLDSSGSFNTILSQIDCGIYICDRHTKELLYANKAALELGKNHVPVAYGQPCHQLFFNSDTPCPDCILKDTMNGPTSRESYINRLQKWLHIDAVPIVLGGHDAVILYVRDITLQKNQENLYTRTIYQLQKLYKNILGSFHLNLSKNLCGEGRSPLAFVLKQQESGTVDGYFAEFSKLIADAAVKKEFFRIFNRQKLIQAFYDGRTQAEIEYPIRYEDGIHWRTGRLIMFENPSTGDVEAMTFAIDIDERKTWELLVNELVDTEFDFVSILNLASETITEYTSKKRSYYEDGKLKDTAYTPAMQASIRNFIHEDCIEEALAAHSIETIKKKLAEQPVYRLTFPTQDHRIEAWRISYLTPYKTHVLIARRDVTKDTEKERERLQELQQAQMEADAATAAKTAFFARINHDMRTPLNGVLGYTDLASRTDDPAKIKDYLSKIHTSGNLLLALINDVLDFGKYASKKIALHPEPIRIDDICRAVNIIVHPLAVNKGIRFSITHQPRCGGFVEVDALRLQQLLVNLLSNSVKFTKRGGTVETIITEQDAGDNLACTFVVRDNGIGMSKEFLPKIFEAYTQEERRSVSKTVGTGLGMAIVKEIIDLMAGSIEVESEIDVGTTFTIHLKFKKYTGSDTPAAPSITNAIGRLSGKRVLLCEDNELNAEIAQLILQQWNMKVRWVADGQAAVDEIKTTAGAYDIVLMDKRMPLMDGIEATKAIRRLEAADPPRHMHILAMTGDVDETSIHACLDAGMDAHVGKPIDRDELARAMLQLLR